MMKIVQNPSYLKQILKLKLPFSLVIFSNFSHAQHFQLNENNTLDIYATFDAALTWGNEQANQFKLISGGLTDSIIGVALQTQLDHDFIVNAKLESAVDLTEGQFVDEKHHFNQAAWLGIKHHDYGELRMGRQYTAAQHYISNIEIAAWKDFGMGALLRAADNYQVAHQVSWFSPEIHHFSAAFSYSPDIAASAQQSPHKMYSFATQYALDTLLLTAGYEKLDHFKSHINQKITPQALQLGMKYELPEQVQIALAWSRQKNGFVGLNGMQQPDLNIGLGADEFINDGKFDAFYIATALPLFQGEMQLHYSSANLKFSDKSNYYYEPKIMSVGYLYPISEQLKLYSSLAHAKNYDIDHVFSANRTHLNRFALGLSYDF